MANAAALPCPLNTRAWSQSQVSSFLPQLGGLQVRPAPTPAFLPAQLTCAPMEALQHAPVPYPNQPGPWMSPIWPHPTGDCAGPSGRLRTPRRSQGQVLLLQLLLPTTSCLSLWPYPGMLSDPMLGREVSTTEDLNNEGTTPWNGVQEAQEDGTHRAVPGSLVGNARAAEQNKVSSQRLECVAALRGPCESDPRWI